MKNFKLTFEFLLFLIIFFFGSFFRLIQLGNLPLSDSEAIITLQALNQIKGNFVYPHTDQTFLVNVQSVLFSLFGSGNFISRFIPALFGSFLIFIPFLFRNYFNRRAMIILAFWIAISPTMISVSRQVDSTMIFLVSILLFIYFFFNKSIILSSIFLVLSILCGKIFFMVLFPAGISILYVYLFTNKEISSHYHDFMNQLRSFEWIKFVIFSIIGYALLSTFGFIFPRQLSGIGYGITNYINSWSQIGTITLADLTRGLFFYEFSALIFGLAGVVFLLRKFQAGGLFVVGFITINIVQLVLIADKNVIYNSLIIFPLMVAGAFFINHNYSIDNQNKVKVLIVTFISFSIIVFITLAFMSMMNNTYQTEQENVMRLIFIIAGFGLIIGAGLLAGWAISWEIAGKSFLYLFLIIFLVFTVSSSINASGLRTPYHNEILYQTPIPLDAYLLVSTLEDYSEWNYGEKNSIKVFVLDDQPPSLIWALRDFSNIDFGKLVPMDEKIDVIITSNSYNLERGDSFRGQDFLWISKPDWTNMSSKEFAQWFFTRRAPQDLLSQQSTILWIKNSLFPGSEPIP